MHNLYTLCFYEDPAAIQEIKFWESLVYDKIVFKLKQENIIIYFLHHTDKREDYYEIVYCISNKWFDRPEMNPINYNKEITRRACEEIITDIELKSTENVIFSGQMGYYKSLFFGKFDSNILKKILSIVEYLEN